jgi:hypothetical protein
MRGEGLADFLEVKRHVGIHTREVGLVILTPSDQRDADLAKQHRELTLHIPSGQANFRICDWSQTSAYF